MLRQVPGVSSAHQGKEKSFYEYMAANTYISKYSPIPPKRSHNRHPLDFNLWSHFIPLVYSAPI